MTTPPTRSSSTPEGVTSAGLLLDPVLGILADALDDLERTRIANENRVRQLTRSEKDKDGATRGFALRESEPSVARLIGIVEALRKLEHDAELSLKRRLRSHPLGVWAKAQKGIGDKQVARLLAVLGDPYWNDLHGRPRTVSELWAYCGYHVHDFPADHDSDDAHRSAVGGDQTSHPDQGVSDAQRSLVGVAAKRRKGVKSNWSTIAKTRAYLIAESCMKAGGPYREVYDKRKERTVDRVHPVPCPQCDGAGSTKVGTPWKPGHRHTDALRITAKEILADLWRESKRIHDAT